MHSHSHLILDPESACYDDFEGGFAPSEVIVKCRFGIKDQSGGCGCGFYAKYKNFWTEVLIFDKN